MNNNQPLKHKLSNTCYPQGEGGIDAAKIEIQLPSYENFQKLCAKTDVQLVRLEEKQDDIWQKPIKNWLDYFLNRDELYELLERPHDMQNVINLCDQFIEQALATEKELAQIDKRFMDQEDLICMRHKAEDLWLCASSCFVACDWNLELLNKSSNIIRIQALLNRLVRWVFEIGQELDPALLEDPFNYVCNLASTSNKAMMSPHVFITWIYTRWILLVGLESRFPSIPAKPTVSNPYVYVDQSLLQAERLAEVALDVQRRLPDAVRFMNKLLESGEEIYGQNSKGIDVPAKQCFYPGRHIISKESPLSVLQKFPKPDFDAAKWTLPSGVFASRTMFDLVVANFAARHFKTAKSLVEKIKKNWVPDQSSMQFSINTDEFNGYMDAFGLTDKKQDVKQLNQSESPLMEYAAHRPKHQCSSQHLVELTAMGICRLPSVYRRDKELRHNEEMRVALIETFNTKLRSLKAEGETDSALQISRIFGTLYFLCSHCPGFSDTLNKHEQFLAEHNFKTRPPATLNAAIIPPKPSEEQLNEFSNSENCLWNILTSFDITVLRSSFARLDSQYHISNSMMVFSKISADPILSSTNASNDRFFFRNQVMLWKLEQLARMGNVEKWKELVNKFSEDCKAISENPELQLLLMFDSMRIELSIWNANFYRPFDSIVTRNTAELKNRLNGIIAQALQHNKTTLQLFSKELACYLLNNREWTFIVQRMGPSNKAAQPLLATSFTNAALAFAFFFHAFYIEKDREKAFKTAREVIWKVITPTFDAQKPGQEVRQIMLTKEQLLEFLVEIKDPESLSILIGIVCFLYNFAMTTDQKAMNVSVNASFLDVSTLSAVANAMDASASAAPLAEDPIAQQHNAGVSLLRTVGRHIYLDNIELWQAIKMDEYRNYDIDIVYIEKVLDLLYKQAKLVGPVYVPWLRFRADYAFVRERYNKATKLYLETAMAIERGVLGMPGVDSSAGVGVVSMSKLSKKMDMDLMFAKLAVSLYFLRMPTLAAIVGQMRADIGPHLNMVEHLLRCTPATVDSGPAYFSLIADIHLMERMAVVYEHPSLDLPLYRQALLNSMPTRAINVNNQSEVLERECQRRKERFMEVLYKQFFGENIGRK